MENLPLFPHRNFGNPSSFNIGHPMRVVELGELFGKLLRRVMQIVRAGWMRSSQRAHLRDLDAHLLKDLGLTKTEVWRESRKAFWQA